MKTLITLAVGLGLAFAPASKTELKFSLEKGKTYGVHNAVNSVTKQSMMGEEMVYTSSAGSTTYFKLNEDGDKDGLYELWYDDISLSFSGMGQETSFGSADTANPMGAVLAKVVQKKFQARIGKDGSINEVLGLEEMIKAISTDEEGNVDQTAEQISASFGEDGLARNLERGLNFFPEKALKKGDTWKKTQLSDSGMPLLIENTYTLLSTDATHAMIGVEAVIGVDPDNATGDLQGMEATYFLEGTRKGTLKVELKTGWVTEGNMEDDIAGSITIEPNASLPDGLTLPMEIKNEITLDGTK